MAAEKKQIVLDVDSEIAELFQEKYKSEKDQIEFWFSLYFRKPKSNLDKLFAEFLLDDSKKYFFLNKDGTWNKQALDAVSDEAEARGLTPEILEEILNEK